MSDTTTIPEANARSGHPEGALLPPVDVIEDASGITMYADLPGVKKDAISLKVEADTLTIEGEISLASSSCEFPRQLMRNHGGSKSRCSKLR